MNNDKDELLIGAENPGNILVVDDNDKNLQIISMALTKFGYKVAVANSGTNALKYLERKVPDLILLDIMMPEMDGYEFCRQIKSNADLLHIPIIFLTAKNEIEDLVNGFKLGAVDYLIKPFHNDELAVRVNTHIQLKKSKDLIKQKNLELEKLNHEIIQSQNRIVRDAQQLLELNYELMQSQQKLKELE
jgi:two-component system sensor histidine kinase/response regulator